jgi:hypothetical protein
MINAGLFRIVQMGLEPLEADLLTAGLLPLHSFAIAREVT